MNELIEKLKDKNYVRVFGLMTPEEQECFMKVGKKNCLFYSLGGWNIGDNEFFVDITTYAINPDYQPEPEFVDLEIVQNTDRADKWLGVHGALLASYDFVDLHCLPSLPKFKEFWYYREFGHRVDFCCSGKVASLRDRGETVYARFRK